MPDIILVVGLVVRISVIVFINNITDIAITSKLAD